MEKKNDHGIDKVLVIGAGTLGVQIANLLSMHGIEVTLNDINKKALQVANEKIQSDKVNYSEQLSADAYDLVIESIVERLDMKQELFRRLEQLLGPDVIFVTNSSFLLPSKINKKISNKNRFCSYHFYWPDEGANIVDIMPTKKTDCEIVRRLQSFSQDVGLEPIVINRENHGYVYNYIFSAMNTKAITLVIKGISNVEDIDKSVRINLGCNYGPFQMMDMVGLDTVLHITRNQAKRNPKAWFGVWFINKYVKMGKLGIKSGEGFYKYE